MDKDNPFAIELPKSGEKLDLSPIVMPLLHALRAEMRDHELRCHWGNGPKKAEVLQPDEMYAYMVGAVEGLEYNRIINTLDRAAIVSFLKQNGYKPEDSTEFCFPLFSDKVWVYGARDVMNYIHKHEAVSRIARDRSKTKIEMAREIESMNNVLDRIAHKL
jgi:hypothetical protein